jgi:glycosyltransferase involved in cell wall biosynthesis
MTGSPRRVAVYHPGTQHSLLLARALVRQGYDTSLITRFETESAMLQSPIARLACNVLGRTHIVRRAVENRSAGEVRSFSTDPIGVVVGRLIREAFGRSAMQGFTRSRMRHSAKVTSNLMRRQLHPELVIAAETGALELLEEVGMDLPVVIDVAHPHPKEVDRCRQLASCRYPGFASSWGDPRLEDSGWEEMNKALIRATGVWTASHYTERSLRTFVDPAMDIDVVGYGVAAADCRPARGPKYKGHFLFVGSAELRKGVPLLLEAWAKAGLAKEGCVLDLVGRKADPKIEALSAKAAGVRRHVDISNEKLSKLFHQADALVSPSYCEGFGRVLLEATSVGLPFLATRTGAVDDILGPELHEWSVEVDDPDGFTEMLRRYHDNSYERRDYADALRRIGGQWTEEAYSLRLRCAVQERLLVNGSGE